MARYLKALCLFIAGFVFFAPSAWAVDEYHALAPWSILQSEDGSKQIQSSVRAKEWEQKIAQVDLNAAPGVLDQFPVGEIVSIQPAPGGLGEHGRTLLVETTSGKYALKPINNALYPDLLAGARYEVSVVNYLVHSGLPVAPLVKSLRSDAVFPNDQYFVQASNGKIYLLYRWMEGEKLTYKQLDNVQRDALADFLSAMHNELSAFSPDGYRTRAAITDFSSQSKRIISLRERIWQKRFENPSYRWSAGELFFLDNVGFILHQIRLLARNLPWEIYMSLPRIPVHGDFHTGNAAFKGNQLAGVFDWDHLREEVRIYDFFHGIFDMKTSDNRFNMPGLMHVVSRYEKTNPLTDLEKAVLPEIARIKFLDGITWIVHPEKLAERHMYDLSAIDQLEQAIAMLDRNPFLLNHFQEKVAILRDIDKRIADGSFARSVRSALPLGETFPKDVPYAAPVELAA